MKDLLLSVRPKWCEKICHETGKDKNGKPIYEKVIEVRKSKSGEVPFKCHIYCTKDTVGEIGRHLHINEPRKRNEHGTTDRWLKGYDTKIINSGNLAYECYLADGKVIGEFICDRLYEFTYNHNVGEYNIGGDSLKRTCLTYDELKNYGKGKTLYGWHISDLKIYDKPKELNEFVRHDNSYDNTFGWVFEDRVKSVPLTRPPQSWCYVEGEK